MAFSNAADLAHQHGDSRSFDLHDQIMIMNDLTKSVSDDEEFFDAMDSIRSNRDSLKSIRTIKEEIKETITETTIVDNPKVG